MTTFEKIKTGLEEAIASARKQSVIKRVVDLPQNTPIGRILDSETDVYIGRFNTFGDIDVVFDLAEWDELPTNAVTHVATVTIRHPEVMAGSWDEIRAEFASAAVAILKLEGLISTNESGVEFWNG